MTEQNYSNRGSSRFQDLTARELEYCAERAENLMNRGLEQHRWNVVRAHRNTMLAVEAERRRRQCAVADADTGPRSGRVR